MNVDPGALARTADEQPELMDAVLAVIKARAEQEDDEAQRQELRRQLNGH